MIEFTGPIKLYIGGELVANVDKVEIMVEQPTFLETENVPFFNELDVIEDIGRVIVRLLSKIVPIPKKTPCTIYDFPDWLCTCVENNNTSIEILIVLCRLYCRQSFMINSTHLIKAHVLRRIEKSDKLRMLFDQASLPHDSI